MSRLPMHASSGTYVGTYASMHVPTRGRKDRIDLGPLGRKDRIDLGPLSRKDRIDLGPLGREDRIDLGPLGDLGQPRANVRHD